MRKQDIKRGTLLTLLFAVGVYAVITIFLWINQPGGTPEEKERRDGEPIADWSASLTNARSDIDTLRGMDRRIERFMGRWNIKGVSFAITRNDSLLYAKGYGMADVEQGIPMTPTTIMRIASASKLVTGVAVMKLVEQGRLRLDSKVFGDDGILNYPEVTVAIRDPRMLDITVDHLLRHQGGFTLGAGDPMFNTKDIMAAKRLTTPPDSLQLVRIVSERKLGFTPGSGHRYSNYGYMLLSLVIEKVTGKSYWDYVTEAVLRPAGVYGLRPATNYYAARHKNESRYYGPDDEMIEEWNGSGRMVPRIYGGSNVNGLMGAGGWCASAPDMARLVAAIDGYPGVKDVLGPSAVSAMTTHSEEENAARGWGQIDPIGRWIRTGTLSSTHALIEHFPDGECWVMITNSGVWTGYHFSSDMKRLVDQLRSSYSTALPARNLW